MDTWNSSLNNFSGSKYVEKNLSYNNYTELNIFEVQTEIETELNKELILIRFQFIKPELVIGNTLEY